MILKLDGPKNGDQITLTSLWSMNNRRKKSTPGFQVPRGERATLENRLGTGHGKTGKMFYLRGLGDTPRCDWPRAPYSDGQTCRGRMPGTCHARWYETPPQGYRTEATGWLTKTGRQNSTKFDYYICIEILSTNLPIFAFFYIHYVSSTSHTINK